MHSDVNCRPWAIMMIQYRVTICNEYATLVGMSIVEEAVHVGIRGI